MWTTERDHTSTIPLYRLRSNARRLTFDDVIDAWRSSADFRAWFGDQLAKHDHEAFRFETPSVTRSTRSRAFEFALVNSPSLVRESNPRAFERQLTGMTGGIATFDNLGGDARLVVPVPEGPPDAYGHLAAFLRTAPWTQRNELWRVVGEEMQRRIDDRPVWLNTAGAGVPWLHVRLDDTPKYYQYSPYRSN